MALDLRAEPQGEPAARQLLQVPGAERGHCRAAREGDRDRGGEPNPAGRLRRQRHDDERVVLGLLGDDPVIADFLGEARIRADPRDVDRRRRRAQPGIERTKRQQRFDFHVFLRSPILIYRALLAKSVAN